MDLSSVIRKRCGVHHFYRSMSRVLLRLLVLAGLWWLLTGHDGYSWLMGGPVIVALALWQPIVAGGSNGSLQLSRLLVFIPVFGWRTIIGSSDVAWRALNPRLPIDPVVYEYPLRLPQGSSARVFFVNCLSLLPGTLTVWWEDDVLRVHVLTEGPQVKAELRELERQIALLFDHDWTPLPEETSA
jgi:multicomponent Na+:H+ antiporter subunit E